MPKLLKTWKILSSIDKLMVAFLLLIPAYTHAQESDDLEELDPFVMTGSRIPRFDLETPNPVQVISRRDIDISGAVDVQGLLRDLPNNQLGLTDEEVFGFTLGASGVNLRGAGLEYTLTLINGRRAAPYGIGAGGTIGFVNTSSIPISAIDRIEILTDGASSIYGSDAISGVVNYILRKDFQGVEVGTNYTNTFDTDTGTINAYILAGNVTERSNIMIGFDFQKTNPLYARDRDFSKSSDQSLRGGIDWPTLGFGFPPYGSPAVIRDSQGNFYVGSRDNYTTEELLNNRMIDGMSFQEMRDAFGDVITQPTDFMALTPSHERFSGFGTYNYEINDNLSTYSEFSFSKIEVLNTVHPVAMDTETEGITVSADNPYNPLGVNRTDGGTPEEVVVYNRNIDIGNRVTDITTETIRFVAGLEGTILDKITWNLAGTYMTDGGSAASSGSTLRSATNDALTSSDPDSAWNVFGRFSGGPYGGDDNNESVIPSISATSFDDFESKLYMVSLDFGGELVKWGGSNILSFAAGLEYRQLKYYDIVDAANKNGDLVGRGGGLDSFGSREANSAYIEFNSPLGEKLEVQVAGRYEKFSGNVGSNFSPKVALKFRATDWIMARVSYTEGFRAPSLQQLFAGEQTSFRNLGFDPYRGNENLASIRVVEGGNPNLKPEESESIYAGIVLEPGNLWSGLKGLSLSVDWVKLDISNRIEGESMTDIIDANDERVVRGVATPEDISNGYLGKILEVKDFTRNKAGMRLENVDFNIKYVKETDNLGRFEALLKGSYLYSRKTNDGDEGSEWIENAGTWLEPEWRVNFSLDWTKGDWGVYSTVYYMGQYEQYYYNAYGPELAEGFLGIYNQYVDEYVTCDIGVSYKGLWGTTIKFQLMNIFDEEPPLSDADQIGFDAGMADPFKRQYRISLSKAF